MTGLKAFLYKPEYETAKGRIVPSLDGDYLVIQKREVNAYGTDWFWLDIDSAETIAEAQKMYPDYLDESESVRV